MLKTIKHYIVHVFGLTLSLSAIYHTMTQFSDNPLFSYFFGIGGVFAGLAIQYLRGLAAAYRRRNQKGDKSRAVGLWVVVIICICIFDFTSSFGILVTQIDKGEERYCVLDDTRREIQDEIKILQDDIRGKKAQQNAEFFDNKGRGKNYDRFETEIGAMEERITELRVKLAAVKTETKALNKSIFARLSEKSGVPAFWIEFTMFAGLMFLIYFVPLLTPWRIRLEGETSVTSVTNNNVTPPPVKLKTPRPAINVTGELCACGCGRPRRPGSIYHKDGCRVRLLRHRRALEKESRNPAY